MPKIYTPEFFAAWETFADELTKLAEADSGGDLKKEQDRSAQVCVLAARLLRDGCGRSDLGELFASIGRAVNDAIDGAPHPLLQVRPKPSGGRFPDIGEIWETRANLCIAVEFMVAGGARQADIARDIGLHHKAFEALLRDKKGTLRKSIPTWAKSFRSGVTGENNDVPQVALEIYRDGIRQLQLQRLKIGADLSAIGATLLSSAEARAKSIPLQTKDQRA